MSGPGSMSSRPSTDTGGQGGSPGSPAPGGSPRGHALGGSPGGPAPAGPHPAFPAVVVHGVDAETLTGPTASIRLLADSSATAGALSTQRVSMAEGADGAVPHAHRLSSELFYVLSGSVQVLVGDRVVTGDEGDLVVVPPGMPHAFAASPGRPGELRMVLTPGVERFEYFRHLGRIAAGQLPRESLLEVQDRYDTDFLPSPAWQAARAGA